jgi:hypothetical protein
MAVKRWARKSWWVVLGAWGGLLSGCGDSQGSSSDTNPFQPEGGVDCGDLTCKSGEICTSRDAAAFLPDRPTTYACAPWPAACSESSLCDCDLREYDGLPVVGCSIVGERTLYLVEAGCGNQTCSATEACLLKRTSVGADPNPQRCAALPEGCTRDIDFCDGDCSSKLARAEGFESAGCFSSDYAVGVYIR